MGEKLRQGGVCGVVCAPSPASVEGTDLFAVSLSICRVHQIATVLNEVSSLVGVGVAICFCWEKGEFCY